METNKPAQRQGDRESVGEREGKGAGDKER